VRDLTAAEHHRHLHLVLLFQEAPRVARLGLASLEALGDAGGVDEASLVTRHAYLDVNAELGRAAQSARHGVALARAAGDPDVLQDALYTLHYALGGPEGLDERGSIAAEIGEVARRSKSPDRAVIALLDVACDRLEVGDPSGTRALADQAQRLAGDRPHPGMRWHLEVFGTGLALLEGRTGEVETRAAAALSLGVRAGHPFARGCANAHRALLARDRGDARGFLDTLGPALRARQGPTEWVKAAVGRAHVALGNTAEAAALFETLAAHDFTDIARNLRWKATLNEIGQLCADLGDSARAEALEALLAPYAEHHAIMPMAILYGGPLHLTLSRLAELLGRGKEAREHRAAAVRACDAIGAVPLRDRIA
jgi:hypothetical protein